MSRRRDAPSFSRRNQTCWKRIPRAALERVLVRESPAIRLRARAETGRRNARATRGQPRYVADGVATGVPGARIAGASQIGRDLDAMLDGLAEQHAARAEAPSPAAWERRSSRDYAGPIRTAIRANDERAALLTALAKRAESRCDEAAKVRYFEMARDSAATTRRLREIVTATGVPQL